MTINVTTPALLFSAISLLLLAYTNRFLALSALVRDLHRQYRERHDPIILAQITSLRRRIHLIKNMQLCSVISFFMCTASMGALFINRPRLGEVLFGLALLALMVSLAFSVIEVRHSCDALEMRLRDITDSPP